MSYHKSKIEREERQRDKTRSDKPKARKDKSTSRQDNHKTRQPQDKTRQEKKTRQERQTPKSNAMDCGAAFELRGRSLQKLTSGERHGKARSRHS